VQSYCAARAEAEKQTLNDMQELVLSFSRLTVPIYHRDRWYRLRLLQSQRNASLVNLLHHDQIPPPPTNPNQPPITIPAPACAPPAFPEVLPPALPYSPPPATHSSIAIHTNPTMFISEVQQGSGGMNSTTPYAYFSAAQDIDLMQWIAPGNVTGAPDGVYATTVIGSGIGLDYLNFGHWQGSVPATCLPTEIDISIYGHVVGPQPSQVNLNIFDPMSSFFQQGSFPTADQWTPDFQVTFSPGAVTAAQINAWALGNIATVPGTSVGFVSSILPDSTIYVDSVRARVRYNGTPADEIQSIYTSGFVDGTIFTLSYQDGSGTHTTAGITYLSATNMAATIQAALNVLSPGNFTVTGFGTIGSPWLVTFQGSLANQMFSLMGYAILYSPDHAGLIQPPPPPAPGPTDPVQTYPTFAPPPSVPGIASNIPAFDGGYRYDLALQLPLTSYPTPPLLADAPLLFNRLTAPSLTLCEGVDYLLDLENQVISFANDPFNDPRVATRTLFDQNGKIVDQEATLWMFQADFDWNFVYEQFGYVLGVQLQSSEFYRDFVNRLFDALTGGTSELTIQQAVAVITGVPLVVEPVETVQVIDQDSLWQLVITDQHTYKFPIGSSVLAEVGQVVHAGDPLVDTVEFFEFRHGEVPADLNALAIGPGLLAYGYYDELIFHNAAVPLEVNVNHPSGYTYLNWSLGGFPLDVQKFFDDLHANGVAANQTLAMLLDTRSNKIGQPTVLNLPTTINPLAFLLQNVLRANAWVVKVKVADLGPNNLGIYNLRYLRKVLPSSSALIVLLELSLPAVEVRGCLVGSQQVPFAGNFMSPLTVRSALIGTNQLSARVVSGTCQ
jgi:hypothetical protein